MILFKYLEFKEPENPERPGYFKLEGDKYTISYNANIQSIDIETTHAGLDELLK